MKKLLVPATLALVATWSCTSSNPLPPDDGGTLDGGGKDAGVDAGNGQDAGPGPDECGGALAACDAGAECLIQQLDDGGRGRRCLPGACNLITQDCGASLKCDYRDGGRNCVADGTLAEGSSCLTAGNNCVHGTVCTTIPLSDGGADARCTRFCGASGDCTAPQQCLLTLVLGDSSERPQVCADPPPTCDLLTQSCPTPSDGCYPNGGTGSCFSAGSTALKQPCVFSNDCGKGATCVNTTGGASCRALCAFPSGDPACDGGSCVRLTGTTGVGVCI